MQRADSFEKTLMLGKTGAGGEGDDRGWDSWMASPTQWTWVWVSSRSWWWTGRPCVLQSMRLQRVRHDWMTELNWTELILENMEMIQDYLHCDFCCGNSSWWRRQWQPTPVLLPGKSHGWRSLVGCVHGITRVGHDWATSLSLFAFIHWRRKWQPTPVFLPGESQGLGSLVGCRLWGHTELDMTEVT